MTDESNDDEYRVGYCRPPKHTQFKKGQSGNPPGRQPDKKPTLAEDLTAELKEKTTLIENGRQARVTKQRALIKATVAAAIKSNIPAVKALMSLIDAVDRNFEPTNHERVDTEDLDAMQKFIDRQRQAQSRQSKPPVNKQKNNDQSKR